MLTSYGTNAEVTDLMDHYDWYILPIANPDGYEYTHTNVSWRNVSWGPVQSPNYIILIKTLDISEYILTQSIIIGSICAEPQTAFLKQEAHLD